MTTTEKQRQQHLDWLIELTAIPTAAGREQRVIRWIESWVKRRKSLKLERDKAGNLLITRKTPGRAPKNAPAPIFITAHLDHPAFVVRDMTDDHTVELEFRGGVQDAYFENARIEIIDEKDRSHPALITALDRSAKPFKRATARLTKPTGAIQPGDVGRWWFENHDELPLVRDGRLHTHVCDDLAAVAAALAVLELARNRKGHAHVGLLFTRAEEVGFVGAIAACKGRTVPKSARLICLENSRSFAESPIGGGPILRVGDRISVFSPALTNRLGAILLEHQKQRPEFTFQRKLMPGGACEATAFSTYGYRSTCVCLPLGNYHNMTDIDGVAAGARPARVGPEFISVDDYHGMIELLLICAAQLDDAAIPPVRDRMEQLLKDHKFVLEKVSAT